MVDFNTLLNGKSERLSRESGEDDDLFKVI
jgi:hypothetical protein